MTYGWRETYELRPLLEHVPVLDLHGQQVVDKRFVNGVDTATPIFETPEGPAVKRWELWSASPFKTSMVRSLDIPTGEKTLHKFGAVEEAQEWIEDTLNAMPRVDGHGLGYVYRAYYDTELSDDENRIRVQADSELGEVSDKLQSVSDAPLFLRPVKPAVEFGETGMENAWLEPFGVRSGSSGRKRKR
jgi:hypothetical protein